VEADARDWLAARGYQPGKGARALHRVIEEEVVSRIGARLAANPREHNTALRLSLVEGVLEIAS
jgi:ATP-dependent Clp protease ATP-binding subunit ClpA